MTIKWIMTHTRRNFRKKSKDKKKGTSEENGSN